MTNTNPPSLVEKLQYIVDVYAVMFPDDQPQFTGCNSYTPGKEWFNLYFGTKDEMFEYLSTPSAEDCVNIMYDKTKDYAEIALAEMEKTVAFTESRIRKLREECAVAQTKVGKLSVLGR